MKRPFFYLILFIYFTAIGIIYSYPLIRFFSTGMTYLSSPPKGGELVTLAHGDYLQLYYYLWLFKDALSGHSPLWKDPYQLNVPQYGVQEQFNNQFFPLSLFFAVIAFFAGDVMGYNLLLLLTFPLGGIGFFLLMKTCFKSFWPAFLGATVFALIPYRVAHLLGGHPGGFTHFYLPWMIYFYVLGIVHKKWIWGLISGLCYFGLGWNEFHVAFYVPVFMGILFLLPVVSLRWSASPHLSKYSWRIFLAGICVRRIWEYMLLVLVSGLIMGAFLAMWTARRTDQGWVWLLILLGPMISLGAWLLYSFLAGGIRPKSVERVMKEDALSFLSSVFFAIYPIQFDVDVIGLGSKLILVFLAAFLLIKAFFLLKSRKEWMNQTGMEISFVGSAIKNLIAFAFPSAAVIAWHLYEKAERMSVSIMAEGRPFWMIRLYSPKLHHIYERFQSDGERYVYPGLIAVLIVLGIVMLAWPSVRRQLSPLQKFVCALAIFLFLLTYALAFGPNIDYYFPIYNFFYQNVPNFSFIRVPTRILYLSFFFLSVLVSFGAFLLARVVKKGWRWMGGIMALAIILDFLPGDNPGISILPRSSPLYEYVSNHLGNGRILEIPIWPGESAWSSIYLYYTTLYRHPMINGYCPQISLNYVNHVFGPLQIMNTGEITPSEWKLLRDWDVRFVLMHEEAFPPKVSPFPPHETTLYLKESPFLEFVRREGPVYLFKVADHPRPKTITDRLTSHCIMEGEDFKLGGDIVSMESASRGELRRVVNDGNHIFKIFSKVRGFPKGHYQLNIRVRTPEEYGDRFKFQVWNYKCKKLMLEKNFSGGLKDADGFQEMTLNLESPEYFEMEIHVISMPGVSYELDRVLVGRSGFTSPITRVEAESLWHRGEIADDSDASGKEAVRVASPIMDDRIFGPYWPLEEGRYAIVFWIKSLEPASRPSAGVAELKVTSNYGREELAKQLITQEPFEGQKSYIPFKIDFYLDRAKDIEFVVTGRGGTDFWIDCLELRRLEKPE